MVVTCILNSDCVETWFIQITFTPGSKVSPVPALKSLFSSYNRFPPTSFCYIYALFMAPRWTLNLMFPNVTLAISGGAVASAKWIFSVSWSRLHLNLSAVMDVWTSQGLNAKTRCKGRANNCSGCEGGTIKGGWAVFPSRFQVKLL